MKLKLPQEWPYILVLLLFAVPLFFLNVNDFHNWGDDYAQYIKEAQNIAAGKPYYQSNYIFNDLNTIYAPFAYPPGFPLLLAPVVKYCGIGIRPLLMVVSAVLGCLLFALFFLFRKYMGSLPATCLSLVVVYSEEVISLKQNVLSDIPLTLMTTTYLVLRKSDSFSLLRILLLIVIGLMAILTRSQGVLILFAEAAFFILQMVRAFPKNLSGMLHPAKSPSIVVLAGIFVLNFVLSHTIFYAPIYSWGFYSGFFRLKPDECLTILRDNFNYLTELLSSFAKYNIDDPFWHPWMTGIQYSVYLTGWLGFIYSLRKKMTIDTLFFIFMCAMIIALPIHQGLRYLLPAIPVFMIYFYTTTRLILHKAFNLKNKSVIVALTIFYLLLGNDNIHSAAQYRSPAHEPPYGEADLQAFDYLSKHLSDTDVVIFTKPRALTLYTNLHSINVAWMATVIENRKKFESVRARYVLVRASLDDFKISEYIATYPPTDTLKINDLYVLYRYK